VSTPQGLDPQHNETLVRVQTPTPGLKVKTQVKAGKMGAIIIPDTA